MTFEEIGIQKDILKAITELGFETPTPIQAETIPHLLQNAGQDLLGFAQTGTGKTAAFGLPIIQQINIDDKQTQSIILAPTRELCIQIAKDLEVYSKYLKKLRVVPVYGGASIDAQIKALAKGAQIVVGTPGRTLDLINRKRLKLKNVRWLVLDEADEMLNMGFKEELDKILSETPDNKQTLLFSATMPKDVARIAREYMKESKEIRVGEKNAGAENVSHSYYIVNASDKYAALKRIADINPDIYGIVFCRTRRDTKEVADKLIQDGYNADALHGDLSQAQRDIVMQRFRVKNLQILVATDVAARGLDVENLTHIINYSLPDDPEIYVHRSGRTGRAGKKGLSLTIAHSRELSKIKALERMVKKPFAKELIPGGIEIVEKRLYNLIDNIKQTDVDEKQIAPFLDDIFQKFEGLSREELIQKFVSVEFTRFLKYYKGAKDINLTVTDRKDRKSDRRSGNAQFTRFFINLGSKAGVNAAIMIGIINDNTHTRNMEIGKIDIMKRFSFFEVEKHHQKDIIQSFRNAKFRDQKIIVEVSETKPSGNDDSYGN
ncbi:MAG: ATP-dependent helicase, partial [Bacteroidetes bacterium]